MAQNPLKNHMVTLDCCWMKIGPWRSVATKFNRMARRASRSQKVASKIDYRLVSWRQGSVCRRKRCGQGASASWKSEERMSSRSRAWKRNCFDLNHSNVPGYRMSNHRTYCRTRDYDRSYWLRSWYSASQAGSLPWLESKQVTLQSTYSQERYERSPQSMMNYWNELNFIFDLFFIFLARMDGLWIQAIQNSPPEISAGFQNPFSSAFPSVLGGQESRCPMDSWA